jgi:mevalonate pyrophosphate decarboxylase
VKSGEADSFVLNGKEAKITNRMIRVLARVRERVRTLGTYHSLSEEEWSQYHFKIVS